MLDDSESEHFTPTNAYAILAKSDQQIADDFNKGEKKEVPSEVEENENEQNEEDIETRNRQTSLVKRMFSKMEAGSLRGSIFAMSSLALGTGCLTLPLHFEQMSFVVCLVVLILGAMASYWSLTLLIKACASSKIYDYSKLVKQVWGPAPAVFLDINMMIYIVGILISYQCISKQKV
jgi:hypothetical protein